MKFDLMDTMDAAICFLVVLTVFVGSFGGAYERPLLLQALGVLLIAVFGSVLVGILMSCRRAYLAEVKDSKVKRAIKK